MAPPGLATSTARERVTLDDFIKDILPDYSAQIDAGRFSRTAKGQRIDKWGDYREAKLAFVQSVPGTLL